MKKKNQNKTKINNQPLSWGPHGFEIMSAICKHVMYINMKSIQNGVDVTCHVFF